MAKLDELPPLSEAQTELMNIVWQKSECSVAEVLEVLNEQRSVSRNTVLTMLTRLEEKGWLTHRESSGLFIFRATVSKETSQKKAVKQLLDTSFSGSAESLVLSLLGSVKLSKGEIDRIRKLIEAAKTRKES